VSDYFEMDVDSAYMLLVAPVRRDRCIPPAETHKNLWGIDLLNVPRSDIPAVTHIDYSARVQTVHEETNPAYHKLLKAFEARTGCGVVVNTSFNVRGEPIVCSPEDAYRCFMRTEIDLLVLGNYVCDKDGQKPLLNDTEWRNEFVLD
jgi:carbamoyltransferase